MRNYFVAWEKKLIVDEYRGRWGDIARISKMLDRSHTSILRQIGIMRKQGKITIEQYKIT